MPSGKTGLGQSSLSRLGIRLGERFQVTAVGMVLLFNGHTALESVIENGERNKERFQGELYAVYVCEPGRSKRERITIRKYFDAAKKAGASSEVLESDDPVSAIVDFAHQKRITQIFTGHSARNSWRDRIFSDPVLRLIRAAEGIDVLTPGTRPSSHSCLRPQSRANSAVARNGKTGMNWLVP